MMLSLRKINEKKKKQWKGKIKQTNKQQQIRQKQQRQIKAPIYMTGGYAIRQLLWMTNR